MSDHTYLAYAGPTNLPISNICWLTDSRERIRGFAINITEFRFGASANFQPPGNNGTGRPHLDGRGSDALTTLRMCIP
jgi:hypothetical protein